MSVLGTASLGVAIVLVSILGLRLHPLVGLLLGSLFLLAATPEPMRLNHQLASHIIPVDSVVDNFIGISAHLPAGEYWASPPAAEWSRAIHVSLTQATPTDIESLRNRVPQVNANLVWYATDVPLLAEIAPRIETGNVPPTIPTTTRTLAMPRWRLVSAGAWESVQGTRFTKLGSQLADGFAKTFRRLGIPVTMAAIIGVCLLESGAAARLVAALIALFGTRGTAPALTLSGFVLGVPVYFDNVFYLLLPLAKAIGRQRPEFYLTAVMAIIVGATMAHSLVPPTPGPLLVATELDVSIGLMMIGGLVVGSLAASVGFAYGALCHRWIQLTPEQTTTQFAVPEARHPPRALPLIIAALPIALPIIVLGGSEIASYIVALRGGRSEGAATLLETSLSIGIEWLAAISDPSLIFVGTAVLAIAILRYCTDQATVAKSVTRGIADAGTIVLLTCAGGAFGAALQQLGLAEALREKYSGFTTPWGMLLTAFFMTTIIRAAQGSATVAMITSVAIVAPVLGTMELPFHPLYVALAIGCGSKPLPWMNDSGFWQVATMTGMTSSQTLRTFSVALTLMGLCGFAVTLLGAWLLPLV